MSLQINSLSMRQLRIVKCSTGQHHHFAMRTVMIVLLLMLCSLSYTVCIADKALGWGRYLICSKSFNCTWGHSELATKDNVVLIVKSKVVPKDSLETTGAHKVLRLDTRLLMVACFVHDLTIGPLV